MMHDVLLHDVVLGRRTTHQFTTDPVPDAVIERALLAAHHAPCHKLSWPWRFTVLGPNVRTQLAEIAVDLKGSRCALTALQEDAIRAKVQAAGALVVVSQVLCDVPIRRSEDYAAVCCAVQNLLLSVTADGFASKWGTGAVTTDPRSYRLLGIDSAAEAVVGFIFVGVAAKASKVARPPLATVVRRVA